MINNMNNVNKIVRLKDIAEALDTSINTVSRALKDKNDISQEMKNKVKKKAMELGYFPNVLAASLRNGSSKVIAVVFDNLLNPYYMIMADMIATKLSEMKYATFIYRLDKGVFSMDVLFKIFSRKVDGIITFSEPKSEISDFCNRLNMPLVLVGRKHSGLNISCVYTDDLKGGYKTGEYFDKNNCKNLAYLGSPKNIECSQRRKEGLVEYIKNNNLLYNEDNYVFIKEDNEPIEKYVDKFIEDGVDGIFCFNDMMAFDTIRYIYMNKDRLKKNIKIVGYDNLCEKFAFPLSITSIGCDKSKMIDIILDILFRQINENILINENIKMDVELVEYKI